LWSGPEQYEKDFSLYYLRALCVLPPSHPLKALASGDASNCRLYPVQPFGMPFTRLLRGSSQPTLARPDPTDTRSGTSGDSSNIPERQTSELMSTIRRPWKAKRPSSTDRSNPSQPTPTTHLTFKAKGPATESRVEEMSPPVPTTPSVLPTNVAVVPSPPEIVPAIDPLPDKLANAWDAVKDDPNITNVSRALDTVGQSSASSLFFFHILILDSR
jgi:hypothetical protein